MLSEPTKNNSSVQHMNLSNIQSILISYLIKKVLTYYTYMQEGDLGQKKCITWQKQGTTLLKKIHPFLKINSHVLQYISLILQNRFSQIVRKFQKIVK
jgi:hypothetical protein